MGKGTMPKQPSQTGPIPLGRISLTAPAIHAFSETGKAPSEFLLRHRYGDWGDVDQTTWAELNLAAISGGKLVSRYILDRETCILVETCPERLKTEILLEQEF